MGVNTLNAPPLLNFSCFPFSKLKLQSWKKQQKEEEEEKVDELILNTTFVLPACLTPGALLGDSSFLPPFYGEALLCVTYLTWDQWQAKQHLQAGKLVTLKQ